MNTKASEQSSRDQEPQQWTVTIKAGTSDVRVLGVQEGQSLRSILEVIGAERGCAPEELIIFMEGEDKELPLDTQFTASYPFKGRHHVHHRGQVNVKVFYGGGERERDFRRNSTVEEVLAWAIDLFNIDPELATEMGLARLGQKEEIPPSEHIGHLARRHHTLQLDLIRGDIANGAS